MHNYVKMFGAAIIFTVLSMVVHTLSSIVEMPFYMMENYFAVWSKIMMPGMGPPGLDFYILSFLFTLISGFIFVWVFNVAQNALPGHGKRKGIWYGFAVFLLAGLSSSLSMVLIVNIPLPLIVMWTIDSFIIYILGGIVTERLLRQVRELPKASTE